MIQILRRPTARYLYLGEAVSILGDHLFMTTFPVWLLELTGSPAAGGITVAIELTPVLALGMLIGVWVDRLNKFRTMFTADVVRAIGMLVVTGAYFLPQKTALPIVWGMTMVMATASLFFTPSRSALAIRLIPQEELTSFTALMQTTSSAVRIIGPLAALALYGAVGPAAAFFLNAVSYLISLLSISRLPSEARQDLPGKSGNARRRTWDDLVAGLRYVNDHFTIKVVLLVVMIAFAGAGTTGPIQAYYVQEVLQMPARFVGLLGTAQGAGMILGALAVNALRKQIPPFVRLGAGLALLGASAGLFGLAESLWTVVPLSVVAGFSSAFWLNGLSTLVLTSISEQFVGRVTSLLNTGQVLVAMASALVGTTLATRLPIAVIYLAVGAMIALSGLLCLQLLRRRPAPGTAAAPGAAAGESTA